MRGAFASTLAGMAARDPRILLLTGDLGFRALEPFADAHPDRFFNVGVAEQNMIGLATGLAEAGMRPYVYSIATFATLRPYEFVRNGPVLHRLPVRIVGVGGGLEYGPAGHSHHALEDLALMRIQPGLAVVAPADARQLRAALHATEALAGPVYLRIGKEERPDLPGLDGRFALGEAAIVRAGADLLVVATGTASHEAVAAAEALAADGVETTVAVVASVAPAPTDELAALLGRFRVALTVENHYVVGGLGSLVSEIVAERGLGCRVVRLGVGDTLAQATGSRPFLEELHGLSSARIARAADAALARPEGRRAT
jgi:transketolase